jgi:hypothetical protein
MAVDVVDLFMALLSFVESAPRAYRLKASNAAPPFFNIRRDIGMPCSVTLRRPMQKFEWVRGPN